MKITRQCLMCKELFSTELSKTRIKAGHGRFCSYKCSAIYGANKSRGKPNLQNRGIWPKEEIILPNGSIIFWDKSFYRKHLCRVPVICGKCLKKRSVFAHNTKLQRFSGLCQKCARGTNSPSGDKHKNWKGGKFTDSHGYIVIHIKSLFGREYDLALAMARPVHGQPRILTEHRLIMAIYLNRPLLSSEIVHHRNGIKDDNRLENLEIVTPSDHRKLDVKYYDLWQRALQEIAILKERLLSSPSELGLDNNIKQQT